LVAVVLPSGREGKKILKITITFTDDKTGKKILERHINTWMELKEITKALGLMFG